MDLEDVLEGTDYLCRRSEIDSARVAILGGSRGAYLAALAIARHRELRARPPDADNRQWVTALVADEDSEMSVVASRHKNRGVEQLTGCKPQQHGNGCQDYDCFLQDSSKKWVLLTLYDVPKQLFLYVAE